MQAQVAEDPTRLYGPSGADPASLGSVLRVADLELDRRSRRVTRAGRAVELTAKEYSLLEYLACSPGTIFSRATIIEHVWDPSFAGFGGIVDVHIRHLQHKLDDPFPTKLIRSVRGLGYSLGERGG